MLRSPFLIVLLGAAPALAGRDGRLVELQAAVFDPLVQGAPELAGSLPEGPVLRDASCGVRPAWLLQLDGPVTRATEALLEARGLERLGTLPGRTLIVRPSPGVPADAV